MRLLIFIIFIFSQVLMGQNLEAYLNTHVVAGGYIPSAHIKAGVFNNPYEVSAGANYDRSGVIPNDQTLYDIASLTKVFTALGIKIALHQASHSLIDWPVDRLETDLWSIFAIKYRGLISKSRIEILRKLKVRDLLVHKTRLKEIGSNDKLFYKPTDDIWISILNGLNYDSNFHTKTYKYRDVHFLLLGKAIEIISDIGLADFFQSKIFTPLGMKNTKAQSIAYEFAMQTSTSTIVSGNSEKLFYKVPSDTLKIKKQMMPSVKVKDYKSELSFFQQHFLGKLIVHKYLIHDPLARKLGGLAGHAGIITSTGDFVKFIKIFLDSRIVDSRKSENIHMISPKEGNHPELNIPYIEIYNMYRNKTGARGEGVDISSGYSNAAKGGVFPNTSFGHLGFTGTSFWVDACSGFYYVFLTNRTHSKYSDSESKKAIRSKRRKVSAKVYTDFKTNNGDEERAYACNYIRK